jgi:hypothetical protein
MTVEDEKPPNEIAAPSPPAQPPPEPIVNSGVPIHGPIPRDVITSAPQDDPSVLSGGLLQNGNSNNSVKSTVKSWKSGIWGKKRFK